MKSSTFFVTLSVFILFSCKKNANSNSTERQSTKAENVQVLNKRFSVVNAKGDKIARDIWLYLPPDYSNSDERYPVIYIHDGQNVFDSKTSYAGEWGVDELLNDLYTKTKQGFIVVGINNVGAERMNEYSPWTNEKYGGGSGDRYIQMIAKELKPFIDATYRTKPKPESTAIIGSSMGGLISYYAGLEYPEVFGKSGVISPSFWFSKEVINFTKQKAQQENSRMYLLLGDQEGMTEDFNTISKLLLDSGFPSEQVKKELIKGGKHNEAFWNSQFLNVVSYLFELEK